MLYSYDFVYKTHCLHRVRETSCIKRCAFISRYRRNI